MIQAKVFCDNMVRISSSLSSSPASDSASASLPIKPANLFKRICNTIKDQTSRLFFPCLYILFACFVLRFGGMSIQVDDALTVFIQNI